MKVVITGGGSGGHFYPLISVADKIREIADEKKIIQPQIIYMAEEPYNEDILFKNEIKFIKIHAGKLRLGGNILKNIKDIFKTGWGILSTLYKLFKIYPDVIFTNGGYVAFPVLVSARILGIPVIIHVSDTVPSRVLLFSGKFAKKITIAFPEAAKYFNKKKVFLIGNPLRDEIKYKEKEKAHEFFNLDYSAPVIWILGGSQGSKIINETIMDALPELVKKYQILHQVGEKNYNEIYNLSGIILLNNQLKNRYKVFPYMNDLSLKMAAGVSDLVIARAGAGTINEISNWGLPAILIPLSPKVSRDQESNSFSYARTGAAIVIRQKNLKANILINEINKLFSNKKKMKEMSEAAKKAFIPDAERKIAESILDILLEHQI